MLEICIQSHFADLVHLDKHLDELERCTDVPFGVVLAVDGGERKDVVEAKDILGERDLNWVLSHEEGPTVGYSKTMEMAFGMKRVLASPLVAVWPVLCQPDDVKWFGKMQTVFAKDQRTMMVGTDEEVFPNTMNPYRLDQKYHPQGRVFMTRGAVLRDISTSFPKEANVAVEFSKRVHALGGHRWVCPSVRFTSMATHVSFKLEEPEPEPKFESHYLDDKDVETSFKWST